MPAPAVQRDAASPCTSLSGRREDRSRLVPCPSFAEQHLSSCIFHPGAPSHSERAPPLTRENWCLHHPQETLLKANGLLTSLPPLPNLILTIKVISFHCRKPGKRMKGTALLKVYFQKPSADFDFVHSFVQSFFGQQILKLAVLAQSERERGRK